MFHKLGDQREEASSNKSLEQEFAGQWEPLNGLSHAEYVYKCIIYIYIIHIYTSVSYIYNIKYIYILYIYIEGRKDYHHRTVLTQQKLWVSWSELAPYFSLCFERPPCACASLAHTSRCSCDGYLLGRGHVIMVFVSTGLTMLWISEDLELFKIYPTSPFDAFLSLQLICTYSSQT